MKFMIFMMVAFHVPGDIHSETGPGLEFDTRAACEMRIADVGAQILRLSHGYVYIAQHACIQVKGAVPRFPVIEKIAEGWERA